MRPFPILRIHFAPGTTWSALARKTVHEIADDNILGRAAELAYYFLFSIFPMLIVLTSLLGMLPSAPEIREDLLRYFRTALPGSAYGVVAGTLEEITDASSGGKLSLGILITLASASSGMVAIIEALNVAYEVSEVRSWLRRRAVAIVLTLSLALFTMTALSIVLYGAALGRFLAGAIGFQAFFESVWPFVRWPLLMLFAFAGFAIVYRFAPNVRDQKWHFVLPGAAVALGVWLLASLGLRLYLRYFDRYTTTYGSLGAVIVLMIWFYFFGTAILIGGEVNSVIEGAAARGGDPEAKLPGEKAPGERRRQPA